MIKVYPAESVSKVPSILYNRAVSWQYFGAIQPGYIINAGALTAGVYSTLLDISGSSGEIKFVGGYRNSSFTSGTITLKVTIDGTAIAEIADTASALQLQGFAIIGATSYDTTVSAGITYDHIRFDNSFKVELKSSVGQTSGKASIGVVYTLD